MDNKYIEQDHQEFVKSDEFQEIIKQKIEHSEYYKFQGIAPEGFVLVPIELIEELKDLNNWLDFKNKPDWIEEKSKKILTNTI